MQTPKLELKRLFLVASRDQAFSEHSQRVISHHIAHSTVFAARDGREILFKVSNVFPHVVILDTTMEGANAYDITSRILAMPRDHIVSVILIAEIPEEERFVEEIITRQVQFLTDVRSEEKLTLCITRALNRISLEEHSSYKLRFLAPTENLFFEGEVTTSVFFVVRGTLDVYQKIEDKQVLIGKVQRSEFVGEMAHMNGQPRSATVRAVTDCELIEVPSDTLDLVLFSKPTWAKAMIATLSKRLKKTNDHVAKIISDP